MTKDNITIADFFREQIIKRQGKITPDDVQEIIRVFENTFPNRDGRPYWNNYAKHIVKHWGRNGEHPNELANLMTSLGYNDDDAKSGPPDEGLRIKSKDEKDFTERFVVPYLESEGHDIIEVNANRRDYFNTDIVSEKGELTYYTEVKKDLGNHRLQTAIGQLFYEIF